MNNSDIIELRDGRIKYENLLVKIASFIYVTAARETTTCCWCVHADEIEECFGLPMGWITGEIANDISATLYREFGQFIAEIEVVFEPAHNDYETNRYFDVDLFTNYCPGILEDDCSLEN